MLYWVKHKLLSNHVVWNSFTTIEHVLFNKDDDLHEGRTIAA